MHFRLLLFKLKSIEVVTAILTNYFNLDSVGGFCSLLKNFKLNIQ